MDNLYQVPLALESQKLSTLLLQHFDLEPKELGTDPPLAAWEAMVDHMLHASDTVRIAVAGKYTKLSDAYLSLLKVNRMTYDGIYINGVSFPFGRLLPIWWSKTALVSDFFVLGRKAVFWNLSNEDVVRTIIHVFSS